MTEQLIVDAMVTSLKKEGFKVATEIANFHRCVDILALNNNGELWAIECKVSNINKAIIQSKTHLLSVDRVFIATSFKKTKAVTISKIKKASLGLFYVMDNGLVKMVFSGKRETAPWSKSRSKLVDRLENS